MTRQKAPWFPLYAMDMITDRKYLRMDWKRRGIYNHLLCLQWIDGALPKDINEVQRIAGVGDEDLEELGDVVDQCFPVRPGGHGRANPRLDEERVRKERICENRRRVSMLGVKARQEKKLTTEGQPIGKGGSKKPSGGCLGGVSGVLDETNRFVPNSETLDDSQDKNCRSTKGQPKGGDSHSHSHSTPRNFPAGKFPPPTGGLLGGEEKAGGKTAAKKKTTRPKKKTPLEGDALALCKALGDSVRFRDPKGAVPKDFYSEGGWGREARLLVTSDGRPFEEVLSIIAFVTKDPFWSGNVFSMVKLRQQYSQLLFKLKQSGGRHEGKTPYRGSDQKSYGGLKGVAGKFKGNKAGGE